MDNPIKRKKHKSIIIGLILVFLFVAGTVLAFLAVYITQNHISETKRYNEQYKSADNAVMLHLAAVMDGTSSDGLSYVAKNRNTALKEIEQSREAVDYFAGIDPPRRLSSEMYAIKKSEDSERAYLNAAEKVFRAETESQLEDGLSAVKQSDTAKNPRNRFSNAVADFMKRLEQLTSSKYKDEDDPVFIWL
ncbi:MAG: hypothetical protein HDT42_05840 [Ruminococcaceae bacterium]|nr:hypothetical protein [Oscillospiraceae bacterium]